MEITYRPPDREKYLLSEEIASLLKAAGTLGQTPGRALKLIANTGIRPSELLPLTPESFNLSERRVRVLTLKQKGEKDADGNVLKAAPKRFRDVDLSPDYIKELPWLAKHPKDTPLFPLHRTTLWRMFKRAAKSAGLLSSYTIYSLRHSRAIYLLEWTGDLEYVAKQLGHSNTNVTRVYLHCIPSKRQDYVSKLKAF
jgi:integrase